MSTSQFTVRTRIVAGRGCVADHLAEEVLLCDSPVVAVVADRGLADVELLESLLGLLNGVEAPVCGLIGENPNVEDAEVAALAARERGAGAVLGIGGGSALGAAKAVAIRLTNDGELRAWEGRDRVPNAPVRSIAVPTTAGSGGEVSNALVLHDEAREVVIRGQGCEPDVALLDGEMLETLPRGPMVYAALDALTHALEALWAQGGSSFTDALALDASATILDVLEPALQREPEAMQRLMEASAMANLACGNAGLAVVHALSSCTAVELAHGYQNGVLLPHVARFNRDAVRRPEAQARIDALAALYDRVGFNASFADDDIGADVVRQMVAAAIDNPFSANNIRPVSEADLFRLLADAGAHVDP